MLQNKNVSRNARPGSHHEQALAHDVLLQKKRGVPD